MTPRSLLFVPGDQPALAAKAAASEADAVCVDLEDAVADADKDDARSRLPAMAATVAAAGKPVYVRVNPDIKGCAADAAAIAGIGDGVILPKTRDMTHVGLVLQALAPRGPDFRLIAMIEDVDAAAAFAAPSIHRGHRPFALTIGAADIGCAPDGPPIARIFGRIALAAAQAGAELLGWPGSIGNFRDLDALRAAAEGGAAHGAVGGLCVHPAQAAVLNAAFTPTAAQIDWARRVLAAWAAAHGGVAAVDGRMVDKPVVQRAEAILDRAEPSRRDA